jgi:hypothetical protein
MFLFKPRSISFVAVLGLLAAILPAGLVADPNLSFTGPNFEATAASAAPEPSSFLLIGAGLLAVLVCFRTNLRQSRGLPVSLENEPRASRLSSSGCSLYGQKRRGAFRSLRPCGSR